MLDIPSHHILFLVTIGVGYLTQELLFEFAFKIGNLRQSTNRIWSTRGYSLLRSNRGYPQK